MENKLTVSEAINETGSAYVVGWKAWSDAQSKNDNYIIEELQSAGYWVGGNSDGTFTSNSNINFGTPRSFESYLKREYVEYYVFSDESDRDDWLEENLESVT